MQRCKAVRTQRIRNAAALTIAGLVGLGGHYAFGTSASWVASPTDSNWVTTSGETNWSTGDGSFPGSISGTTSTDTATFNTTVSAGTLPIVVNSSTLNIGNISFATSAGSYTVGTTSGNSLFLTAGDSIAILSTLTATGKVETINAPLVLEGDYTFANNGTGSGTLLNVGGAVSAVTNSSVLTLNGTNLGANTISGNITDGGGTLSLTKSGTGTWVLSGTNGYSLGTTINGGLLTFSNSAALPSTGLITLNSGGALSASGAFTNVLNWLNSGKIVTSSTGTLAITTSTNTETLDFSNYPNLSLGATITSTYSGSITPGASGYRFGGAAGSLTVSSALTGSNALTINPAGASGAVILSNTTNSYSGATTTGGILRISDIRNLGNTTGITVSSGGDLELTAAGTYDGKTITISGNGGSSFGALQSGSSGTTTWSGNVILGADQTRIGTSNASGVIVISGTISSGAGAFAPAFRNPTNSTGWTLLSGINTYLGANTQVVVGNVKLGSNAAFPSTTAVTLGSNSNNVAASLDLSGFNPTINGIATASGNNEQVTITSSSPATLTLNSINSYSYSTGSITGSVGITKLNTGIQTIANSGASNFSGTTTLGGGGLTFDGSLFAASSNTTFGDSNGALVLNGGTLKLVGRANGTVTSLTGGSVTSGSPIVTVASTTNLVVGQPVTGTGIPANAYVASIVSSTSFNLSANASSTATAQTFTVSTTSNNTSQTFTGTTINTGATSLSSVLRGVSTTLALGTITRSAPSALVAGAGTFDIPSTSTGTVTTTTANGSTILGGYATVSGNTWAVSGATGGTAGAITGLPLASYTQSAATSFAGANADPLAGTDVDFHVNNTSATPSPSTALSINSLRFNTSGAATLSLGTPTAGLALTIATGGVLATSVLSGGMTIQYGTLTSGTSDLVFIANQGTNFTVTSTIVDNGGTSVGLTKSGASLYTSYGANTYSGPTTLLAGTYVPQNSSFGGPGAVTKGPIGTGTLVFAGGTLRAPSAGPFVIANNVTLAADPNVPLSNTNANIYSGPVTIVGGPQSFTTNSAGDVVLSGAIGDGGNNYGLTKAGTGRLIMTGANTYTGGTTVSAGTLAGTTAGLQGNITNNAAVVFDQTLPSITVGSSSTVSTNNAVVSYGGAAIPNNSGTYAGIISGTGTVAKNNAGTAIFTGANTYSGNTAVGGGTLVVNNTSGSGTGTGTVNVNTTAVLAGVGFIAGPVNVNVGTTTAGGTISAGTGSTAAAVPGNLTTTGGNGSTTFSQVWNGAAASNLAGNYAVKFNPNNLGNSGAVIGTNSPTATADPGGRGTNWDQLTLTSLNVVATSTNQFNLSTVAISSGFGTSNPFDPNGTYSWPVAVVTGGVAGIFVNGSPAVSPTSLTPQSDLQSVLAPLFRLDPAGMLAATSVSPANAANFSVGVAPDPMNGAFEDIVINYSAAPEPTSLLMVGLGASGLVLRRRRKPQTPVE